MAAEERIPHSIDGVDYQNITGGVTRDDPTSHPTDTGGYSDIFTGNYKATDGTEIKVAIKVLRLTTDKEKIEKITKYLIRETVVWTRLNHPNVLRFLGLADDLGRHGCPALISPWCKNGTIMDYIKDRSYEIKVKMVVGVINGLQYLHGHKPESIIHGDLKPSNILISDGDLPLLCDFGRSRLIQHRGFTTRPNGTHRYQAPELFEEEAKYTKASDIYALGMTCSEILSGKPPFEDLTQDASIILQVLKNARPSCPSSCGKEIWQIFEACWVKEPEKRLKIKEVARRFPGCLEVDPLSQQFSRAVAISGVGQN